MTNDTTGHQFNQDPDNILLPSYDELPDATYVDHHGTALCNRCRKRLDGWHSYRILEDVEEEPFLRRVQRELCKTCFNEEGGREELSNVLVATSFDWWRER